MIDSCFILQKCILYFRHRRSKRSSCISCPISAPSSPTIFTSNTAVCKCQLLKTQFHSIPFILCHSFIKAFFKPLNLHIKEISKTISVVINIHKISHDLWKNILISDAILCHNAISISLLINITPTGCREKGQNNKQEKDS